MNTQTYSTSYLNKKTHQIAGGTEPELPQIVPNKHKNETKRMTRKIQRRNIVDTRKVIAAQNNTNKKRKSTIFHTNALSPKPVIKRRSLQNQIIPLTRDQEACVEMHVQLIEKSKAKVIEAKAARFKGFFSPRLLRQKAHNFTITRINKVLKNDFDSREEFREYMRQFVPSDKVDSLVGTSCTNNKKTTRRRENIDGQNRFFSPQPITRSKSDELASQLLRLE